MDKINTLCIGAGPAGLTAAYLLTQAGKKVTVLEKDSEYVGGISRTVKYKGYHFDIGGHRFFSKAKEVEDFWAEILGNDLIDRPRKSRIFFKKQFFNYPITLLDTLCKLGFWESTLCVLSYLKVQVFPNKHPKNFEEWVVNQFGRRLFNNFFKTYTEKVWGMKCTDISADWAAQRIKGLSMFSAIKSAIVASIQKPNANKKSEMIKTLITTFRYPRKGPGMMWEAVRDKIIASGNPVIMGASVNKIIKHADDHYEVHYQQQGQDHVVHAEHVISSMPVRELVHAIEPALSADVIKAANALKYRDFLIVALIIKDKNQFDDNWIYIHDPSVKVGRIQNFKSWSPEMIPDPATNCYGMEYFCFESDGLWNSRDSELAELAKNELQQLGLANKDDIIDYAVIRQMKAYPVYDDDYKQHVNTIRHALAKAMSQLHLIGRNGMHKYNNQDHAIMTAMLTAKNILAGKQEYDVWEVNQDAEYHEGGNAGSNTMERLVPEKINT